MFFNFTAALGNFEKAILAIVVFGVLALIIALYLWFTKGHEDERQHDKEIEQIQDKYYFMTQELIDQTADDKLVEAVVANIMTLIEDYPGTDAFKVVPGLAGGRSAVYCVWLMDNELRRGQLSGWLSGYTADFAPLCINALETVGAEQCREILRAAMEPDLKSEQLDKLDEQLRSAIEIERPLDMCVGYIRDNINEFVDEDEDENEEAFEDDSNTEDALY